ncbi:LysM peptidoglycan-binding domain-containing protein [Bifidobacterium avesanii]|nr:LysM peptidoglycan-binding domain-containing protein [Bifidobacterium avesanii]KAB8289926.1 peptidoglycan-binding LysM domain [Bifidobacterium avesanii]
MIREHRMVLLASKPGAALRERLTALLMVVLLTMSGGAVAMHAARPSQASGAVVSYTVRPGDTLWSFAANATPAGGDVNDTLDELMRLNHLDSAQLSVGQRIMVPEPGDEWA